MRVASDHTEPYSIDDLNIHNVLKYTLSNELFLIRESSIGMINIFNNIHI